MIETQDNVADPEGRAAAGEAGADPRGGRLRLLVYALALLSSVLQSAIAPLLPAYQERFQLGSVQVAELLAATGVAAWVVAGAAGVAGLTAGAAAAPW